jgi:hypothetical protein
LRAGSDERKGLTIPLYFHYIFLLILAFFLPYLPSYYYHLDIEELIGCGVQFGDDDGFVFLEVFTQLVPDGGQLLAVPAPVPKFKLGSQ